MAQEPDQTLIDEIIAYVDATGDTETALATECVTEASQLIDDWMGSWAWRVPATIRRRAIKETAADLFNRKHARNGVMAFDSPEITPFRIARDPLAAGIPFLRPYIPKGIA